MSLHNPIQEQQHPLVDAIVAGALQPNNHELLRHLGQVLGINAGSRVLLVAEADAEIRAFLETDLGCSVETFRGDLRQLAYAANSFDSAIIAVPVTRKLHTVACELARVLKPNGSLGMVALSVYRDQVPDDQGTAEQVLPLLNVARPAAAYRAVLAECGFTAFVSEDRRRDVRRAALASYREQMLQDTNESPAEPQDAATLALGLMATGGVGVTLITAENSR